MSEKLTAKEVRRAAERLVFKNGGWIEVATRMGMTGEALKRKVFFNASVIDAREWLRNIQRELEP